MTTAPPQPSRRRICQAWWKLKFVEVDSCHVFHWYRQVCPATAPGHVKSLGEEEVRAARLDETSEESCDALVALPRSHFGGSRRRRCARGSRRRRRCDGRRRRRGTAAVDLALGLEARPAGLVRDVVGETVRLLLGEGLSRADQLSFTSESRSRRRKVDAPRSKRLGPRRPAARAARPRSSSL